MSQQQLPEGWTFVESDDWYGPHHRRETEHQIAVVQHHVEGEPGRAYLGVVFASSEDIDEAEQWRGGQFGCSHDGEWDLTLLAALDRADEIIAAAEKRNAERALDEVFTTSPEPRKPVITPLRNTYIGVCGDLETLIAKLTRVQNLARDLRATVSFQQLVIELVVELPSNSDDEFIEIPVGMVWNPPQEATPA